MSPFLWPLRKLVLAMRHLSYSSQRDRCAYYSLWGFRLDYDYESSLEPDSEALCYRKVLIGLTNVCYVMCNVVLPSPPLASARMLLTQQMTQAEIQNKTVNLRWEFSSRMLWPGRIAQWPVSEMCWCIMHQRVSWHVCHEFWSLQVTGDCRSLATTWKGNCSLVNRNISQIWRATFQSERVSNVNVTDKFVIMEII